MYKSVSVDGRRYPPMDSIVQVLLSWLLYYTYVSMTFHRILSVCKCNALVAIPCVFFPCNVKILEQIFQHIEYIYK